LEAGESVRDDHFFEADDDGQSSASEVADAHYLTRLADRLSWRQFLVLALFIDPPQESLLLRRVDQSKIGLSGSATGLSEEVQELGNLGLLGEANADGEVVRSGTVIRGASGLMHLPMEMWRLTGQGRLLVEMARLDLLPIEARNEVLNDLLAQPRAAAS
jgi:hypothetical protein